MKLVSLFMKNAKDTFVGCPGQIKPEGNRNQITYLVHAKNEEIKLGEVLLFKNYSLQKQIKFSPKKFEKKWPMHRDTTDLQALKCIRI